MNPPAKPTYDLAAIQKQVSAGAHRISETAVYGALELGFDEQDVADCVLRLDDADFYKTMPSHSRPGLMQDVYRPTYVGETLYVKVQQDKGRAIIISFKKDESR